MASRKSSMRVALAADAYGQVVVVRCADRLKNLLALSSQAHPLPSRESGAMLNNHPGPSSNLKPTKLTAMISRDSNAMPDDDDQ